MKSVFLRTGTHPAGSALVALALLMPLVARANPPRDEDPAMRALVDETRREQSLRFPSLESPYFVSGAISDTSTFVVSASFGALDFSGSNTSRAVSVQVRVGSAELDNTNFSDPDHPNFDAFMMESAGPVPEDADYDALRQALWLRFDLAYKRAVEDLARKQAYLQSHEAPDRPPDFSTAPLSVVSSPRVELHVDRARWTKLAKEASALFRDVPNLSHGTVSFQAIAENECFATTDPVQGRFGDTHIGLLLSAAMQAPDGMEVELHQSYQVRAESDLPSDKALLQTARDLAKRLQAVAAAPTLPEDYSGPVLFTGHAAARFFLEAIGKPLSHARTPLGDPHEGRLVDRLGKHVTASLLTVRDDPTQESWHGKPLLGWYPVDDDGVKPMPITLIENGVLKTYYMSRIPTHLVKATNGHSRNGEGYVGNLFVSGTSPKSRAELKKELIQLMKENDQDYGLIVDDFGQAEPGIGFGDPGDITLPRPDAVFRVFADGREEPIRGVSFKPATFRLLRDIVAVGSEPTVLNLTQQEQPIAVVAPSVLVKQMELKKQSLEFEKPPAIPRPVVSATP